MLFVLKTKIESPRHARLTEMWAVLAGKYGKAQAKQKSKRLSIDFLEGFDILFSFFFRSPCFIWAKHRCSSPWSKNADGFVCVDISFNFYSFATSHFRENERLTTEHIRFDFFCLLKMNYVSLSCRFHASIFDKMFSQFSFCNHSNVIGSCDDLVWHQNIFLFVLF